MKEIHTQAIIQFHSLVFLPSLYYQNIYEQLVKL